MTPTKEQIDSSVAWSRHWVKGHGDHVDPSKERMHEVIVALADQRDELVALLTRMVKYVVEDRAVTPRSTRLPRATVEAGKLLARIGGAK